MKSTDILPAETLQSLLTLKQIKANFSEIISNYLEVKNGTRKN
jgi:hypothetical protein